MIQKQTACLAALLCLPVFGFGQTLFTKITDPANPIFSFQNNAAQYKGCSWIDLDGDNLTDLFSPPKFLFKNLGGGQFQKLAEPVGATGGQGAQGASWSDIDNDGRPDFILSQLSSQVFYQKDNLAFEAKTAALPNFPTYSSWDCALADANNDGLLDLLFVHACCNFHTTGPWPCFFYLQKPGGTFEQVTGYEFTSQNQPYTIPVWADYDLDGDMDLFIGSGPAANGAKSDFNYRNMLKETGTFSLQRLTDQHWAAPQDGQTYNFVDVENDGDLDVCLTNYSQAPSRFWRNDKGIYTSISTPFTTTEQHLANCWGDIDNDGDLDPLFTADGNANLRVFKNKGNASFEAAKNIGTSSGASFCGVSLADFDNDGDLDAYANGVSAAKSLFRNDTLATGRNWLFLTLEGTVSNRSAIGATVFLKATVGGKSVWQIRQVQAHNSFQSQNDLRQHFGLNESTTVDSLRVRWPSGLEQNFSGLSAGIFYKLKEGENIQAIVSSLEPGRSDFEIEVSPNPFSDSFWVKIPLEIENEIARLEIFDVAGKVVSQNFTKNGLASGERKILVKTTGQVAPGIYFLRILTKQGGAATVKIKRD